MDVYGTNDSAEPQRPNVFAVLWRRRWIVLVCVAVALAGGFVYNLKATPVYSSASAIYVQDNALKMMNDPISGQRSTAFQFTQCQLLTSTAILSQAIEKSAVSRASILQGVDNPVGLIKSSLSAVPDKFSDLITISMESGKPEDAATIVNGVIEAYIDYQGKQHKNTSLEVLKTFQKEIDQREAELQKTQAAMLQLKKDNPELALQGESATGVVSQISIKAQRLLDEQMKQLNLKTAALEAEAVKGDADELRRVLDRFHIGDEKDSGMDPSLLANYRVARRTLNDLLDRLGTRNQLVQQAEKQVTRNEAELKQASTDAARQYVKLLEGERRVTDMRVKQFSDDLSDARSSAIATNFKLAEFEKLQQDAARIGRGLDLLDSRMKEINVNEDVAGLNVSVLETARPSFMPVRPNKGKNLGIALVAGLMAGCGLAMLRDLIDQRLRSADEITTLLDLPILGSVPHMLGSAQVTERGRMVQAKPRSNVSESFRTIRTALSFGISQSAAKTILFTSPAPGDGKSTSVSNLALAFAQAGRRTLLIDADCRRPQQDRIFDCRDDAAGLSDVLSGEATFEQAVRPSGTDKLDLLPCGRIPHHPAELLDSQALLDLLGHVASQYDQVLIDSPPVVAVTDARILAASCDAAVLVLRADKSTRRLAEHAREALASVGANLLGVIVNDVPRGKSGYGYNYYGSGNYGYKATTRPAMANGAINGNGDHGVMQVPGPATIDG